MIEAGAPAVAPQAFTSAAGARVTRVARDGQTISIDVATSAPALLAVDQSYFRAWSATMTGRELQTTPINLDRLGVIVPSSGAITLTFGRHRTLIRIAWLVSTLLLLALTLSASPRLRVKKTQSPPQPDTATQQ
jgi:hypothetical protein